MRLILITGFSTNHSPLLTCRIVSSNFFLFRDIAVINFVCACLSKVFIKIWKQLFSLLSIWYLQPHFTKLLFKISCTYYKSVGAHCLWTWSNRDTPGWFPFRQHMAPTWIYCSAMDHLLQLIDLANTKKGHLAKKICLLRFCSKLDWNEDLRLSKKLHFERTETSISQIVWKTTTGSSNMKWKGIVPGPVQSYSIQCVHSPLLLERFPGLTSLGPKVKFKVNWSLWKSWKSCSATAGWEHLKGVHSRSHLLGVPS